MITVYSKPNCPQCDMTKRHLTANNVPFEVVDVTTTPGAKEKLEGLGFRQVPVVDADGDIWSGFRPERLDALKA